MLHDTPHYSSGHNRITRRYLVSLPGLSFMKRSIHGYANILIRKHSQMQTSSPPQKKTVVSWLLFALFLLAWGVLLSRAATVFGTDSAYVQPFNSDSALPVLMANDERIDAFRTYV